MPTKIHTIRLRLHPLVPVDPLAIKWAAAAHGIADTRTSVVRPCPRGEAARFIADCQRERK